MFSYTIKITDNINKNKIGFISFIYNDKNNKIYISYLNVFNDYKGKGYGTLLILFSVKYMIDNIYNSYFIKDIKLHDCSDFSGSSNSIYYKLGFRNYDNKNEDELFVKFFKNNNNNIKTIYDLYHYIYNNNIDKLNTINFKSITFKVNIFNKNELIKIKDINFNFNKKIIRKIRITRRSKL